MLSVKFPCQFFLKCLEKLRRMCFTVWYSNAFPLSNRKGSTDFRIFQSVSSLMKSFETTDLLILKCQKHEDLGNLCGVINWSDILKFTNLIALPFAASVLLVSLKNTSSDSILFLHLFIKF